MFIAASDASNESKHRADVVCKGADDQASINGALGYKGFHQLSEGNFSVDHSPIDLLSNSKLSGSGVGVTRIHRAPGYQDSIIRSMQGGHIELGNLTVDDLYNGAAPDPSLTPMSVRLWNCTDALVERVEVVNIYRLGIAVSGTNIDVTACIAKDAHGVPLKNGGAGGHGIVVTGPSSNIRITGCLLRDNWRTGIYAIGVDGLLVANNVLYNNCPKAAVDAGIERGGQIAVSYGCTNDIITGNIVRGGYWSQGIERDVTENGQPAVDVARNGIIEGNQILDQGFAGITLYGDPGADADHRRANVMVRGNMLRNCNRIQTHGDGLVYGAIHVFATLTDFHLDGNLIEGQSAGSPAIKLDGKNTSYSVINNRIRLTTALDPSQFKAISDANGFGKGMVTGNQVAVVRVAT